MNEYVFIAEIVIKAKAENHAKAVEQINQQLNSTGIEWQCTRFWESSCEETEEDE